MSLVTAKALREKRANLAKQAQELVDRAAAESRGLTAEENTTFDKYHVEIEEIRGQYERIEKQHDLMASLEETRGRQAGGREQPGAQPAGAPDPVRIDNLQEQRGLALRGWLMQGSDRQPTEEQRKAASALGVSLSNKNLDFRLAERPLQSLEREDVRDWEKRALTTQTSGGGYTVADDTMGPLEKAMLRFGGMRSVASIIRTSTGASMPWPTTNDTGNEGVILGENGQVAAQDLAFGQLVLEAYKYSSKIILVPVELLQDASVDIGDVVGSALGERIGRITNRHFTVGTGAGQPNGIVTASTLGKEGTTGQTTSVIYADLVDLEHSVDPDYRTEARWMFADSTLKALKKITIGSSDSRPLWASGIAVREPDTILGYPYTINQAMPAMAASQKSILFGQLSKYKIRDVRDVTLLRLDERYADYHQVAFLAFSRHDGDLLDAGTHPVKHYANPAN